MVMVMGKHRKPGPCISFAMRRSSHGLKSFAVTLSIAVLYILGCIVACSPARHSRRRTSFIMLVLYETAMGFALFKLTDSAKLTDPNLHKEFETPERASGLCVQDFHDR